MKTEGKNPSELEVIIFLMIPLVNTSPEGG